MFKASAIKKGMDVRTKRVKDTPFVRTKAVPEEDLEEAMELEQEDVPSAKAVPKSKVPSAIIMKPEDGMSMDMMLRSARKSKANASSEEGEEFEVEKDEEGKWSESGAQKERYLKAIGKLKKKK